MTYLGAGIYVKASDVTGVGVTHHGGYGYVYVDCGGQRHRLGPYYTAAICEQEAAVIRKLIEEAR